MITTEQFANIEKNKINIRSKGIAQLTVLLNIRRLTYNQILKGLRDPEIPNLAKFQASVMLFSKFIPRNIQVEQTNTNVDLNELIEQIKARQAGNTQVQLPLSQSIQVQQQAISATTHCNDVSSKAIIDQPK
mgnify:CR=1 FL=1